MLHEAAEAERHSLARDVHEHTYVVRAQPAGWEIVWTNIPHLTRTMSWLGGRAACSSDTERTAELADGRTTLQDFT
jgi:hypothetical protein